MKIASCLFLLLVQHGLTEPPLYLHCLAPNLSKKDTKSAPYQRIVSTRLSGPSDFDVSVKTTDHMLVGHLEVRAGKYFLKVQGAAGSTASFEGEVELEKPFDPQVYSFSGGIFPSHFVLSTNPDCTPFLQCEVEYDVKTVDPAKPR